MTAKTASTTAEQFERLYAQSSDPWGYHTSSYEHQKYAETLAALPAGPVGRCLEVGCSIGVFTQMLARRCGTVVAIDFSSRALELAEEQLSTVDNVEFRKAAFPDQTPPGDWDLIICSEVLYYLDEARFGQAMSWLAQQLDNGACVVAVSWTGGRGGEPLRGDEVHDRLTAQLASRHTLDARQPGYRLDRFEAERERNGDA